MTESSPSGSADDAMVARVYRAGRVESVLQDMAVAESWEAMAVRSVARKKTRDSCHVEPGSTTSLRPTG